MTDERKAELYAALVKEAKAYAAEGRTISRFEALGILTDGWGVVLNRDAIELVEKLYRDGFCGE